jgi:FAD/FMN-containing dehydrogenase
MLSNCVLPPHHTPETFTKALEELYVLLGRENVDIVESNNLNDGSYYEPPKTHDPFHILDQSEYVASIVIRPASTEDVQGIVKIANSNRLPLWPVSIGRNFGYGGAAPRVRGSAVVDLGARMNKVINIDEPQAFALVEPGVTYKALYDEIQRQGLKLWIDVPDLGGGSVLGNTLERGAGYTPYGDHFMVHCGMEVVLPNGEVSLALQWPMAFSLRCIGCSYRNGCHARSQPSYR